MFFQGASSDCREKVKKLNELRCERDQDMDERVLNHVMNPTAHFVSADRAVVGNQNLNADNSQAKKINGSKWDIYLTDKEKEQIYGEKNHISSDENDD